MGSTSCARFCIDKHKFYLCGCVNLTFKFLLTHAREDHTKEFLPRWRYILVAVHSERYEGPGKRFMVVVDI